MRVAIGLTMIRLSRVQRTALSETLRGLANLTAVAFVLGQFVGQRAPATWLILTGIAGWVALLGCALWLLGGADGSNG